MSDGSLQNIPFLPYDLKRRVVEEIDPDESLVWIGQPDPGRMALSSAAVSLFAIPFTAFAIFWMAMAAQGITEAEGPFIFFPLFGLPFLLVGLAMLLSPLWAYRKAKKTAYMITSRRAVVIEGGRSFQVTSYGPEDLQDLVRRERSDGSGDVIISEERVYHSRGRHRIVRKGFFGIRGVKEVEDRLEELAYQHRQAATGDV